MNKKNANSTYFTVGWTKRDTKTGMFVERRSDGSSTKVMSGSAFSTAVNKADRKFSEVTKHSSPAVKHGKHK